MQVIIFFVEVILIFFYLIWEDPNSFINTLKEQDNYNTKDILGNSILKFPLDMDENKKLMIIKKSQLLEKIIEYSPNVEVMAEIFQNGIEDRSDFKKEFINYIKCRHWQYIGGEINKDKFQEFISNPQNLHACQ